MNQNQTLFSFRVEARDPLKSSIILKFSVKLNFYQNKLTKLESLLNKK